jgi:two-component system, sensor histidine kinase and response regulator
MTPPIPNVLLVDDKEANLVALEALLEDMECTLVRADSGNEALRQLLKRDFALVLLDVQMPEMDGFEVARYAHEHPMTRDVPIIFVTATHDTPENALRGYGTGAVDCLFKPVNPHILRSKVRVFLDLFTSRGRLIEEIEAHKATLNALEISNEALRHFTHAASHDLGAPLRAMDGYLLALEEDVGERLGPGERRHLEASRRAAARMRSLLDALLVYAGLSKPVASTSVDCAAIVAQVKEDLCDRIALTHAVVDAGPLPTVRGDPDRLYQLFLNLVANAIKFHRPEAPPRVAISVEERAAEHVFHVVDDGIGIDPAYASSVFEAFRRLHSTKQFEGTGLGLAICRQIVEQHGGRIWVDSEPGQGSAFHFTLTRE